MTLEEVLRGLELAASAWPASLEESAERSDGEPCTLGESVGGEDPTLELVECRDVVARSVRSSRSASSASCTCASSRT